MKDLAESDWLYNSLANEKTSKITSAVQNFTLVRQISPARKRQTYY
jgi:hypothetical protein